MFGRDLYRSIGRYLHQSEMQYHAVADRQYAALWIEGHAVSEFLFFA